MTERTSSSGLGRSRRSWAVRHRPVISSSSRRVAVAWSSPGSRGASRRASSTAIRRRASTTARRLASVGWAVSTGATSSRSSRPARPSSPAASLTSATAASNDSRTCPPGLAALAQGPDPVLLLGQVDQLEVDGEGPGQQLGPVQVEAGDQLDHPGPGLAPAAVGRPQGDGRPPQPLHVLQQPRPPGLLQHPPEQPPEQPHVPPQRRRHLLGRPPLDPHPVPVTGPRPLPAGPS